VFDEAGAMLGAATHDEPVRHVRLGRTPMLMKEIELDFGVSRAFRRAASVVVSIAGAPLPDPLDAEG
jgi:hypothetical protein